MTRRMRSEEIAKVTKRKREFALMRPEMLQPSVSRMSADGATSMAIKVEDPATRAMIDAAIERRKHES